MKRYSRDWETVTNIDNEEFTERLKVPGGWLVQIVEGSERVALTFYPDPEHEWNLLGKAASRFEDEDEDEDESGEERV